MEPDFLFLSSQFILSISKSDSSASILRAWAHTPPHLKAGSVHFLWGGVAHWLVLVAGQDLWKECASLQGHVGLLATLDGRAVNNLQTSFLRDVKYLSGLWCNWSVNVCAWSGSLFMYFCSKIWWRLRKKSGVVDSGQRKSERRGLRGESHWEMNERQSCLSKVRSRIDLSSLIKVMEGK